MQGAWTGSLVVNSARSPGSLNNTADLIISAVGVVVFALFTAYDTQRLLAEGAYLTDSVDRSKGAIMGAVQLYLDFLNLFLYLLRFLGAARD